MSKNRPLPRFAQFPSNRAALSRQTSPPKPTPPEVERVLASATVSTDAPSDPWAEYDGIQFTLTPKAMAYVLWSAGATDHRISQETGMERRDVVRMCRGFAKSKAWAPSRVAKPESVAKAILGGSAKGGVR